MISDPRSFYQSYQKDYHRIKAEYLKKMLDDSVKYREEFFGKNLINEDIDEFRLALKSDLRQTYFHSIETLFELIFALIPTIKDKPIFYDLSLQFQLTYSNWPETYKKIRDIASSDSALDFFDDKVDFFEKKITIGEYLFYMGIFYKSEFEDELQTKVTESIDSIKNILKIIAKEFINREEYNAYKHGLRIIPSVTKLTLVPLDDNIKELDFNLSDSMSFYTKMKNPEDIKIVTKVFDSERDYRMSSLCSTLIHQIIFYRRVSMKLKDDIEKFPQVGYFFFSKQNISDFNKTTVEIQDLEFTQTKIQQ